MAQKGFSEQEGCSTCFLFFLRLRHQTRVSMKVQPFHSASYIFKILIPKEMEKRKVGRGMDVKGLNHQIGVGTLLMFFIRAYTSQTLVWSNYLKAFMERAVNVRHVTLHNNFGHILNCLIPKIIGIFCDFLLNTSHNRLLAMMGPVSLSLLFNKK